MQDSSNSNDELLDRAIAALRDAPIFPGPTPMVRERAVAALAAEKCRRRKLDLLGFAAMLLIVAGSIPLLVHTYRNAVNASADGQRIQTRANTPDAPQTVRRESPTTQPDRHDAARTNVPPPSPLILASNISITGRVFYRGPRPPRRPIDLSACLQCADAIGGPIYDESLVVNDDGSLQNVVVSISGGLPAGGQQFVSATDPVTLDQKGCTFRPHVIAARVGQPIVVKNSDPFLHSVHSLDAEESPAFNFAQPTIGQRQVEPLRAVETFQVTCDLHPWMNAWVRVFNHPYFAVTGPDGSFALPPLPPGRYRIKAWQETLGVREKTVEVRADRGAVVDLTFEAR